MQDEWRARSEADQRTRNRFGARALNPFDGEVNNYRSRLQESLYSANRSARSNVGGGGISAAPVPAASRSVPALSSGNSAGSSKAGGSSGTAKAAAEKAVQPLYISLVDLGKRLQAMGYTVKEHPSFGGVGKHSPNSYHYYGEALDVTDWRGGDWKGRTKGLINSLRGSGAGFAELLGPGDAGHDTHAHIAAQGGKVKLTDRLAQLLGLPSGGERGDQALGVMNQAFDEMVRKIEAAREAWGRMKEGIANSNVLLKEQLTDQNEINRLVMEGLDPTAASEQVARQRELLNIQKEQAAALEELKGIEGLTTDEIKTKEEEINALYAERLNLQNQLNASKDTAKGLAEKEKKGAVAEYMTQLQTQLNDTEGMVVSLAGTVESELGSAMSNAISGLIDGTMTAQEAFSQMFKNIGKAFIDMATQMIAKALVMKVLGIAFGGGGGSSIVSGFDVPIGSMPAGMSFAGGGFTGNAPRTGGLDGQGGFLAMLHPQETVVDHTRAMGRYSAGASQQQAPQPLSMDVNYNVTQINEQRYVTEEQFRAGMRQSAMDGAKAGQAMTLRTMRNSPSTRQRIGI
jgi:hypothetical protein